MGKSTDKALAFSAVHARVINYVDGWNNDEILFDDGEEFTKETLEEAIEQVKDGVYAMQYPGHGTYVDPRDDHCALCQKKKSERTMSTYQVQGMRLTVCRNCVRDLIEQEIMSS